MPSAERVVANANKMPKGTKYEWVTPIDPSRASLDTFTVTVAVVYPDGSLDLVSALAAIRDDASLAWKNQPVMQDVTTTVGVVPALEDALVNFYAFPAGTQVHVPMPPDVSTPGDRYMRGVLVFPDHSQHSIEWAVHVVAPRPDAETFEARGQAVTVDMGDDPNPQDGIANLGELPSDVQVAWGAKSDTTKPGNTVAAIVVTYADGSQDTVEVTVTIRDATIAGGDADGEHAGGGADADDEHAATGDGVEHEHVDGGAGGSTAGDDNGDAGDSEDNHGHDAENSHASDAGSDANRTDGASGGISAAQSHDGRSSNGDTHGRRSTAGPAKQVLPQTGDTLAGGAATALTMGLAMVVAALGILRQRKAR